MNPSLQAADRRAERNQRTAGNVADVLSSLAPSALLAAISEAEAEAFGSALYVEEVSVAGEIEMAFAEIEGALRRLDLIREALEDGNFEVGS